LDIPDVGQHSQISLQSNHLARPWKIRELRWKFQTYFVCNRAILDICISGFTSTIVIREFAPMGDLPSLIQQYSRLSHFHQSIFYPSLFTVTSFDKRLDYFETLNAFHPALFTRGMCQNALKNSHEPLRYLRKTRDMQRLIAAPAAVR